MRVAQLTKWYLDGGKKRQMVRTRPVYVLFEDGDRPKDDRYPQFEPLLTRGGVELLARVERLRRDGLYNIRWHFYDHEDERVFINESDWPDEVCTALARRALLGESE